MFDCVLNVALLCCVENNYFSVNFPTQPYLILFLFFNSNSKLRLFQFFRFSTKLIHIYYQNLATKSYWKDLPVCSCIMEGRFFPAGIYLLKVNNRNTKRRCEICSKLTIRSGVFIVNFEHISRLVLVFLLLTLNM